MNTKLTDAAARHYDWLKAEYSYIESSAHALNSRWVLSLAVGNGAALAALSARLMSSQSEALAALLMPSCWLFALGLIFTGIVSAISVGRHEAAKYHFLALIADFDAGDGAPKPDDEAFRRKDRRLLVVETALEWAAAGCFAIGLTYPLSVMSLRYLTSGHGFY